MEGISIPEDQVVPIESIAPGLIGLRITFVNVFGVTNPDGSWVLIDAGLPFTASMIRNWAQKNYGKPPAAIVLTHGHFDHVSAAPELSNEWNIPVYAHPLEYPYLTGEKEYPAPNPGAGGGAMPLISPLLPRGPVDITDRLRSIPAYGGRIADMPDWTVLHTPGHTPGHVSFFRETDGTLIVGDAFCTTKPESFFQANILQHPELHGPPAYFTSDWEAACESVRKLARLPVTIVAPGHGKPIAGGNVHAELQTLADKFVETAVPENRKDQVS